MNNCEEQQNEPNYAEDLDCIDFQNYKGMFYNDDSGTKYQDEVTGAHFEYRDMCKRLNKLMKSLPDNTEATKENCTTSTLVDKVNAMVNQRKKSSIRKDLVKLIPQVQETRNMGPRATHIYSNTITEIAGKTIKNESRKPNIQRNHSIGHKKPNVNVPVKENVPQHEGMVESKKTQDKISYHYC